MMTRFTPGPWTWDGSTTRQGHPIVAAARLDPVCIVHDGNERGFADVCLITAAPELLAACKSVLESIERNLAADYLPETRTCLRAAIARAEQGATP